MLTRSSTGCLLQEEQFVKLGRHALDVGPLVCGVDIEGPYQPLGFLL